MPELSDLRRVGHKGADRIVPGNTLESFDAALAAGIDMIEFDVLAARHGGELLLAHDYEDAAARKPVTLREALAHLSGDAFAGIDLDLDLKLPGYELAVLDAVRAHGVLPRTLVSTQYRSSLTLLREASPEIRLGWSVPKVSRDPFRSPTTALAALAVVRGYRLILPARAARAIRSRECDAVMAHWRLATPRLASAVREAGGELYVWTVDELPRIRAMQAIGVTGVITNDPRLFSALA